MLKLSTKGRYAVRITVYLASRLDGKPARKQDIADSEGISPDYVEQILIRMRSGGLVSSHRGARGGFTLSCDPAKTSVMDVLEATEGPLEIAPCNNKGGCDRDTSCVIQEVWGRASSALAEVFRNAMIGDLAEQLIERRSKAGMNFEI